MQNAKGVENKKKEIFWPGVLKKEKEKESQLGPESRRARGG